MNTPNNAYLIHQNWILDILTTKYFNTRFLKTKRKWRYNGSVHEYLSDKAEVKGPVVMRMPLEIILYHDRDQDCDKSQERFLRDKVLLLEDHKTDLTEPRALYYFAQTCSCINQSEDAFYYYKLRSELDGFQEEKFHALLHLAQLSETLKHSWYDSLGYYIKAFEHSKRVEPLIKIAYHYKETSQWMLAYTFISLACSLPYPTDAILFIDTYAYTYTRWHIMGIVGYYSGHYEEEKKDAKKL